MVLVQFHVHVLYVRNWYGQSISFTFNLTVATSELQKCKIQTNIILMASIEW